MPFINEFVPEGDIDKHDLDTLWNHYKPRASKMPEGRLQGSAKHYWTIDRSRNIWLMYMDVVYSQSPEFSRSGYPEPTGERIFILSISDDIFELRLSRDKESSKHFDENPFYIFWNIISVQKNNIKTHLNTQEIEIAKSSLTAFGYNGIRRQISNTEVIFNF